MCKPSAAWCQLTAQQRHFFTPTLEGAFFIRNGLVLQPLVSTYRDIWPSPPSAPWRASASPLTSWCLGWEQRGKKEMLCKWEVSHCKIYIKSKPFSPERPRWCSICFEQVYKTWHFFMFPCAPKQTSTAWEKFNIREFFVVYHTKWNSWHNSI